MVTRESRFDILFEPVKIGPLVAKNRFFQVPHCNGMGYVRPRAHAAMRGIKAEGGWAVVSTEEVEIHPSSDVSPYIEGRIWDDRDVPALALMTDAIHAHGALAAIELVHAGMSASNHYSREVPFAPSPIVNPASYAAHKEDWAKITAIYYKCVDYLMDPATRDDAIKIMAAKVGADPVEYAKNVPGTHFLTVAEAKTCLKKSHDMMSIYGSMELSDKFNLDNAVYKVSQKPSDYLVPKIVMGLK